METFTHAEATYDIDSKNGFVPNPQGKGGSDTDVESRVDLEAAKRQSFQ
jgi:hypothetical protein